jgi:hypothetical protein
MESIELIVLRAALLIVFHMCCHRRRLALSAGTICIVPRCRTSTQSRGVYQPSGKHLPVLNCVRFSRKKDEYGLRYVFSLMSVAAELPKGRVIDKSNITIDDQRERSFVPSVKKRPQQLVIVHRHPSNQSPLMTGF